MHVERYGSGSENFLCLHGWNGGHATFEPLAAGLPPSVSLWCPDLQEAGDSLNEIANQCAALAIKLGKPLQVAGNCSGALIGLMVAERVRVTRLVMIDAFAWWPWYFRLFLAKHWGRYAYMTAFANPAGRWVTNQAAAQHRAAESDLTAGFRDTDHARAYRFLQMLGKLESPEVFRHVDTRLDIVYGERSFRAVRESAARWKEIFPKAQVHELAGAGHLPILEATAQLGSILFEESPCLTNCAH